MFTCASQSVNKCAFLNCRFSLRRCSLSFLVNIITLWFNFQLYPPGSSLACLSHFLCLLLHCHPLQVSCNSVYRYVAVGEQFKQSLKSLSYTWNLTIGIDIVLFGYFLLIFFLAYPRMTIPLCCLFYIRIGIYWINVHQSPFVCECYHNGFDGCTLRPKSHGLTPPFIQT